MANKGRAYPRLFERDFLIRNANGNFAFIANQIVCRGQGANWPFPTPTGVDLVSNPGVADYDTGIVTWEWYPLPGADADDRITAELILTDTASFWRARWRLWTSPTFYWGNEQTRYNTVTPPGFPDIFGFPWISSTGITNFLIGVDNIRPAAWSDL